MIEDSINIMLFLNDYYFPQASSTSVSFSASPLLALRSAVPQSTAEGQQQQQQRQQQQQQQR